MKIKASVLIIALGILSLGCQTPNVLAYEVEAASRATPVNQLLVMVVDKENPITEEKQVEIDSQLLYLNGSCQETNPYLYNTFLKAHTLAVPDLCGLLKEASGQNLRLVVRSAYRSPETQLNALKAANYDSTAVAFPGQSQHQTGLAFDFTSPDVNLTLTKSFATTPEGKFLQERGAEFGFVESYIANHDGIIDEPWHWVYISPELAKNYHALLEEGTIVDIFEYQSLFNQP